MRRLQLDDLLILAALSPHSPEDLGQFMREGSSSWSAFEIVKSNRLEWQQSERKEEN